MIVYTEKLSRARKKYLATTYKDFFSALYMYCMYNVSKFIK